jgi:death-on-curing protein
VIVYLSRAQILYLHRLQTARFGGSARLRDKRALESAVARPQATFGGEDLYPDVPAKAAALMHSLVMNHPFADGNKRVGAHAAILFLKANHFQPGFASQELAEVTLGVARGEISAEALTIWIRQRTREREG